MTDKEKLQEVIEKMSDLIDETENIDIVRQGGQIYLRLRQLRDECLPD